MSKRPSFKKKLRRLEKALRVTPQGRIDPIDWLKDHGHAQTTGEAIAICISGRLKSGSHVVGMKQSLVTSNGKSSTITTTDTIDANLREGLYVEEPKDS